MGILGAPGEFLNQGCLAAARLAGDEDHPALTSQGEVEKAVQSRQLPLSGDKDRSFNLAPFSPLKEGRPLVCQIRKAGRG